MDEKREQAALPASLQRMFSDQTSQRQNTGVSLAIWHTNMHCHSMPRNQRTYGRTSLRATPSSPSLSHM